MVCNQVVDVAPVAGQRPQRALLVFSHPGGIAHRIGREYGGEAPLDRTGLLHPAVILAHPAHGLGRTRDVAPFV